MALWVPDYTPKKSAILLGSCPQLLVVHPSLYKNWTKTEISPTINPPSQWNNIATSGWLKKENPFQYSFMICWWKSAENNQLLGVESRWSLWLSSWFSSLSIFTIFHYYRSYMLLSLRWRPQKRIEKSYNSDFTNWSIFLVVASIPSYPFHGLV